VRARLQRLSRPDDAGNVVGRLQEFQRLCEEVEFVHFVPGVEASRTEPVQTVRATVTVWAQSDREHVIRSLRSALAFPDVVAFNGRCATKDAGQLSNPPHVAFPGRTHWLTRRACGSVGLSIPYAMRQTGGMRSFVIQA